MTDLSALKESSAKPLRKSIRVNTLKCSVDYVLAWAKERKWQIEPVPWCKEGFFIDREDRSVALGKDLLHLVGYVYMQEAASMLPVALLDPQPGETILDMSAAPGSKTTQISAAMQNMGVIIANDVQEKRIWVLKTALHRLGCINAIVTKKVGQWFAGNMTERFDRVLCDAPCTAQGTARKDPTALHYSSEDNVRKMSMIQKELLESAIHAAKVGGRIVYSTCTLTPEENEEVVAFILRKFEGKVEAIDPHLELTMDNGQWKQAIDDSERVQNSLRSISSLSIVNFPFVRLWPQTYDTEGFFCAVLRKVAPTRDVRRTHSVHSQEESLSERRIKEIASWLEDRFGTSFLLPEDHLFAREDQYLLSTQAVRTFELPVQDFSLGIPFVRGAGEKGYRLDHDCATLRGTLAQNNTTSITDDELHSILDGKDVSCDPTLHGDVILRWRDISMGIGLAKEGFLKNRLPRWLVQRS